MALVDYPITPPSPVNRELLDLELRAGIDSYRGYSFNPRDGVRLHFENGTQADFDAADVIIAAHDGTAKTPTEQAREDVLTIVQSTVGVSYTDLTTVQIKALLGALLWKAGGFNNDLTVKPLNEWLNS